MTSGAVSVETASTRSGPPSTPSVRNSVTVRTRPCVFGLFGFVACLGEGGWRSWSCSFENVYSVHRESNLDVEAML